MIFSVFGKKITFGMAMCALSFCVMFPVFAQDTASPPVQQQDQAQQQESLTRTFSRVRAQSGWEMSADDLRLRLWGVEPVQGNHSIFKLKARRAFAAKIGEGQVTCTLLGRDGDYVLAQCLNAAQEDLALAMLREGHLTVLPAVIQNSAAEAAYLQAEEYAQNFGAGIWDDEGASKTKEAPPGMARNVIVVASILLIVGIIALGVISYYIMRGFGRVIDVQNKSIDLAMKERQIRDKERFVIAAMLDAEVRENKSKIEAYLTVYEEVLRDLNDPTRTPKYKVSGDIIQKQPALGRSVFDGNTDRLDLMGQYLASDIIHYFARIKTVPDYIDLEPETQIEEARRIVTTAVDGAKKLNDLSNELMAKFVSAGLVKRA